MEINNKLSLIITNTIKCKISNHNSFFIAVCLYDNVLICGKCIISNHSKCSDNLLFLEDLFDDNIDNIIALKKFKNYYHTYQKYLVLIEDLSKCNSLKINDVTTVFDNKINSYLDIIVARFNQLRDDLSNHLGLEKEETKDANKISESFNLRELKVIVNEILSGLDSADKLNYFLKLFDNIIEKETNEIELKTNTKMKLKNYQDVIKKLDSNFCELKNFIEKKFCLDALLSIKQNLIFDENKSSISIDFSENKTRATKKGNSSYTVALVDLKLNNLSGQVKWQMILSGLEETSLHSENQWITFGIVSEKKINNRQENFPYIESIGYSTYNQSYGVIVKSGSLLNPNGSTVNFLFDSNRKVVEFSNQNFFAYADLNLTDELYYPYVVLYGSGNSVKIQSP